MVDTKTPTPAPVQLDAAPPVTVDELRAILRVREADEHRKLALNAEGMRTLLRQEQQQIELAIKAVELGVNIGANDKEPDLNQRLGTKSATLVSKVMRPAGVQPVATSRTTGRAAARPLRYIALLAQVIGSPWGAQPRPHCTPN
jgi:hypothetical protein